MTKATKLAVIVVATIAIVAGLMFVPRQSNARTYDSKPRQIFEVHDELISLRVEFFPETGDGFVGGGRYVFKSSPEGMTWKEVMAIEQDDPDPIPCDQVRVDGKVAFVYMKHSFASTKDAGTTWNVWDARKALGLRAAVIKAANLAADGIGEMTVDRLDGATAFLKTADFGATWVDDHPLKSRPRTSAKQ